MRRSVDEAVALVGLALSAPLWLALAVAIKLDSSGPVLHKAVRVGRDGRLFTLYKFRTMSADAATSGVGLTSLGDSRVTRIGSFLRASKLDEVPQLINVLKGEMSLVGPRPEDPRYVSSYSPEQQSILAYKPGITSPASVAYRNEEELLSSYAVADVENFYLQQVLPKKISIDLPYFETHTASSDIGVLARTAFRLLWRDGARTETEA